MHSFFTVAGGRDGASLVPRWQGRTWGGLRLFPFRNSAVHSIPLRSISLTGFALCEKEGGRAPSCKHGAACGFFPSGPPQCTRFRFAPSRSRASPYAKRKGVWRPHASMGRHTPFLFAHCSLPARTLYQQFFDLYSPKAGGRDDFYRQIQRLVRNLEDVSCRFVSFILCRGLMTFGRGIFQAFMYFCFGLLGLSGMDILNLPVLRRGVRYFFL